MGALISAAALDELRLSFSGDLLVPGDPGYDEARRVHNGLVDRHPGLIARCLNTADVVDAVNLGRDRGVEVSVRGGGHNVGGSAVTEGGLMIDLARMRGVHVDPRTRRVRCQGGVTWREYNRAAGAFGLATTGGAISTTGVAGLTLGGGLGWLMSSQGLALDNLVSAEVVTADGQVRTASADDDPDLFWAIRGGGGNFGVVPWFEFQSHPVGMVTGGILAHPLSAAPGMLGFYREATAALPDELAVFAGLVHAPDGSGMKLGAMVVCHIGSPDQAAADLAPARAYGPPVLDMVGPMPYPVMNTILDLGYPPGSCNYWKSAFLEDLSDDAIAALVEAFDACPSPMSAMVIEHFHGAVTRVDPTATAFPYREPAYNLVVTGVWMDPADTDVNVAWVRQTMAAVEPFLSERRYLNYMPGEADDTLDRAYGPNLARLVQLKRRYDPDNLFHLNRNIPPG